MNAIKPFTLILYLIDIILVLVLLLNPVIVTTGNDTIVQQVYEVASRNRDPDYLLASTGM